MPPSSPSDVQIRHTPRTSAVQIRPTVPPHPWAGTPTHAQTCTRQTPDVQTCHTWTIGA